MSKNSLIQRLLSVVLIVPTAGLALGAVWALRRNCEGFGCPNAGTLWSAWIAVYLLVLGCGWRLRGGLLPGSPSRRIASACLAVLALIGALLAGYGSFVDGAG